MGQKSKQSARRATGSVIHVNERVLVLARVPEEATRAIRKKERRKEKRGKWERGKRGKWESGKRGKFLGI